MSTPVKSCVRYVSLVLYALLMVGLLGGPMPGMLEAIFRDYSALVDQPFSPIARGHYRFIKHHLDQRFDGYSRSQTLTPQFRVVALSHMACGLMNVTMAEPVRKAEITALLTEVVRRAISSHVFPYEANPETVSELGDHGLYLSHLNLILGCYRHVTGATRYDPLHQRVAEHLAAGSLKDGDFHIRSFPESPKWPADQTVTLCSLYLYDKTRHADLSRAPIKGWLAYMKEKATDRDTGLPWSSISDLWYAHIPRGCALSWSSLYMAQFASRDAAELYSRYRKRYFKEVLGCGGFREWPAGATRGMDVDSGPIFMEIGVAASGLGVGPARIFKDSAAYTAIMRSASTCGMPIVLATRRQYRLAPLLGEAILFHGETARLWFESHPQTQFNDRVPFPIGPVVGLLVILAVMALCAWRSARLIGALKGRT